MAQNTSGGTTASFSNTPQAVDDTFNLFADLSGIVSFAVLANDLGGNAKTLWSIDNSISTNAYTSANGGYAPTDLLTKDTAYATSLSGDALSNDTSFLGARIWINSNGTIGYDAANISSQLQALSAGEILADKFTYAIRLGNGTLSWATATINFTGVNKTPVAVADVNAVMEDTTLATGGNVLSNDTDINANDTHSVTAVNGSGANVGTDVAGIYGTLHLNADGSYTYTLNNS